MSQIIDYCRYCSVAKLCPSLCDPMDYSTPYILYYLQQFAQTHVHGSVVQSNLLVVCHPLLLSPSIFPSIGVFSNELALLQIIANHLIIRSEGKQDIIVMN